MATKATGENNSALPDPAPGSYSTVELHPAPAIALPSDASTLDPAVNEPKQIGRYRILRILGRGGMGKVYEAYDVKLERTVALKVMLPDALSDPAARDRFLREARAMAKVRNDHIVTVFEVDEAGATPYLAMEFLHGQSLSSWLGHGNRPRIGDVVRIGREIAVGLAAAQAKGLIHRDIKPGNLWLERLDDVGKSKPDQGQAHGSTTRIKILDFGLARPTSPDSAITQSGAIMGTPFYMSPEQARGHAVDGRSDLFSLGVVLYQLSTGNLPFKGPTVTAVLTSLAVDEPPPIIEQSPHVPKPLADLIMGLLKKDPAARPQSAEHVAAALRAIEKQLPEDRNMIDRSGGVGDQSLAATLGPSAFSNTLPSSPRETGPSKKPRRSRRSLGLAVIGIGVLGIIGVIWSFFAAPAAHDASAGAESKGPPIRLGLLYSRTGRMAVSERPILDGMTMAVAEINAAGGVLGRTVEFIAEDGQSDDRVFAQKATKLIEKDKALSLFGCWTSASRKLVLEVVEKHDRLLFNPTSYEGLEESPNIIYGGAVPNQQVLPALRWTRGFLNKSRWYLVGLDAINSRGTHAVIRDEAANMGATIVGEDLLSTENTGIGNFLQRVHDAKPDLIVSTIKGDTNAGLYRAIHLINQGGKNIPILSFCATEAELANLTPDELAGHLAAQTYFHSADSPINREFVQRALARFGADYVVSDQMQTTYLLVHLWAKAVNTAGSEKCKAIRHALKGLEFDAPQGKVMVDPVTQHLHQVIRVGKVAEVGRFEEVYVSPQRIRPEPFPATRTRAEWEAFTNGLFELWGHRWHNLGLPGDDSTP